MDLTGKVALITGGTAGIGEATVHRISRTGAKVVFVGRDEENGRLIESELKNEGRDAFFLRNLLKKGYTARNCSGDRILLRTEMGLQGVDQVLAYISNHSFAP